jgi:hypothetical protein
MGDERSGETRVGWNCFIVQVQVMSSFGTAKKTTSQQPAALSLLPRARENGQQTTLAVFV